MKKFSQLKIGDEIETDVKTYRIIAKDLMGRLLLHQVGYFFQLYSDPFISDDYDSYEECSDAMRDMADNEEDDVILEEIAEAEVEEHLIGKKFWIHYKDLETL